MNNKWEDLNKEFDYISSLLNIELKRKNFDKVSIYMERKKEISFFLREIIKENLNTHT